MGQMASGEMVIIIKETKHMLSIAVAGHKHSGLPSKIVV